MNVCIAVGLCCLGLIVRQSFAPEQIYEVLTSEHFSNLCDYNRVSMAIRTHVFEE